MLHIKLKMALLPVSSMVPLVTVVAEAVPSDFSILESKKKSIKLTKPNARCCTHCYNLGYNTTVCGHGNSDSNVANHVNQLDFIV